MGACPPVHRRIYGDVMLRNAVVQKQKQYRFQVERANWQDSQHLFHTANSSNSAKTNTNKIALFSCSNNERAEEQKAMYSDVGIEAPFICQGASLTGQRSEAVR